MADTDVLVHFGDQVTKVTLRAKMSYSELEAICLEKFAVTKRAGDTVDIVVVDEADNEGRFFVDENGLVSLAPRTFLIVSLSLSLFSPIFPCMRALVLFYFVPCVDVCAWIRFATPHMRTRRDRLALALGISTVGDAHQDVSRRSRRLCVSAAHQV